jgi:hypothetical protein
MTNSGYTDFADSQIENFSKPFLSNHKLFIYCLDKESFLYHKGKELPSNITISHINAEIGGHHSYLQGRFKEMMRLKFPIILNAMNELKTPIWFVDNDVLFLKDPESYLDVTKDILFQADMGDYPSRYGWVCTGAFWINNTDNAISLLKKISDLQDTVDRGEQEVLNDYCKSWPLNASVPENVKGSILDFKEASLDILPYYLFQNGCIAFKHNEFYNHDVVMVHFNHETNYEIKLSNLKKAQNRYSI